MISLMKSIGTKLLPFIQRECRISGDLGDMF